MSVLDLFDHIATDRLIRRKFTDVAPDGRQRACLLAAISPEVAESELAASCPAALMPAWLAHLTPWIDDAGSAAAWPGVVRRYAYLAARWHVLDAAAWARLEYAVRAACVREAMRHTRDPKTRAVCDEIAALCDRVAGGEPMGAEFELVRAAAAAWAAEAAAAAAVRAAAVRAARATAAAAWAAEAAATAAAVRAAAVRAAVRAAAEAAAAAAWAAEAAAEASADCLAKTILDLIETACEASADRLAKTILDLIETACEA